MKTDNSDQEQYRQYKLQQKRNNWKQKRKEKQLYEYFKRQTTEDSH